MPCFPKHTIRASTSCGFPSGTLNMCVYDRSLSLKRMLERWAKVHLKHMVVRVLRARARGGVRCTRDASLDCPRTGKVTLHACTEGTGHTNHTRTPATLTQGSSVTLNSGCTPVCTQSGPKRNLDYDLLDYEENDDDNMKRQRGEGGGVGPYEVNDEWGLGGRAPHTHFELPPWPVD